MDDKAAKMIYAALLSTRVMYQQLADILLANDRDLNALLNASSEHVLQSGELMQKIDATIELHKATWAEQPPTEADIKIPMPICPYCKADPIKFVMLSVTIPPGILSRVTCCLFCRVALSVQGIAAAGQGRPGQIATPNKPGGLWVPGMPRG